jgi:hypothetical protein
VLKELDANDAVEDGNGKFVINNIASNDSKVGEILGFSNRVNVRLLRVRVGEGGDLRVWKARGKVNRC